MNSNLKTCQRCNTKNPRSANFCRRCRYEFPETTKDGMSLNPEIKYLRIRESQYVVGSIIHVEWEVANSKSVKLEGEEVTLCKEVELVVKNAVELQLVASNDYNIVKQSIKVVPYLLPIIHCFLSSHSNIKVGEAIKLFWRVANAKKILLKSPSGEFDVTLLSEIEITPVNDTTYTLVAYSVDEFIFVSCDVAVRVMHDVLINKFSSDTSQIIESQYVELSWDVLNADKIMLYPDNIDVTCQNSIRVFPNRTITYRIVASNAISLKEALLSIGVQCLPKLDLVVPDSLLKLEIPNCEINLNSLTSSIRETNLTQWILSPAEQEISKQVWGQNLWRKIKGMLSKRVKL